MLYQSVAVHEPQAGTGVECRARACHCACDPLLPATPGHHLDALTAQSVKIDHEAGPSTKRTPVPWLPKGYVQSTSTLGTHATTAQVHPRLLTNFLTDRFLREPGCTLVLGTARALGLEDHRPSTLMVTLKEGGEKILDIDTIVLTNGPWLGKLATEILPSSAARRLAVDGQMAHSLVIRTREPTTPHVLFVDLCLEDGAVSEPEVYPRPDGTTLV